MADTDDFARRRQHTRKRARAFWQAYTRTVPAADSPAACHRAAADRLLARYFPALVFQVASTDAQGRILTAAFDSANKTAPLAEAQLLAEAAPDGLPFRIDPWPQRQPAAQTAARSVTFGGATVAAGQVLAACTARTDGLIRLDICPGGGLPPEHDGQQLAVWQLLTAALGQWDLNVKVAEIAFAATPPAAAVPLPELAAAFDRC